MRGRNDKVKLMSAIVFRKILAFTFLLFSFLFINIVPLLAAYDFEDQSGLVEAGYEMGYDSGGDSGFWNKSLPEIIGLIIKIILSFLGVIFLVLMIYGGYTWMTARGNEQQVTKAKDLIIAAVIGLIIVLSAYAITAYIGGAITG